MQHFILNSNQQANGDYEVHNKTTGCSYMPAPQNQIDLGWHTDCHGAVEKARQLYQHKVRTNGCAYCCPSCHTS